MDLKLVFAGLSVLTSVVAVDILDIRLSQREKGMFICWFEECSIIRECHNSYQSSVNNGENNTCNGCGNNLRYIRHLVYLFDDWFGWLKSHAQLHVICPASIHIGGGISRDTSEQCFRHRPRGTRVESPKLPQFS